MRITVDEARKILKEHKLNVIIIFTWDEKSNQFTATTAGINRHYADQAYEQSNKLAKTMGYEDCELIEDKRHEHID